MATKIKITKIIAQLYEWAEPIKTWHEYNELYNDYYNIIIIKWQMLLVTDL